MLWSNLFWRLGGNALHTVNSSICITRLCCYQNVECSAAPGTSERDSSSDIWRQAVDGIWSWCGRIWYFWKIWQADEATYCILIHLEACSHSEKLRSKQVSESAIHSTDNRYLQTEVYFFWLRVQQKQKDDFPLVSTCNCSWRWTSICGKHLSSMQHGKNI